MFKYLVIFAQWHFIIFKNVIKIYSLPSFLFLPNTTFTYHASTRWWMKIKITEVDRARGELKNKLWQMISPFLCWRVLCWSVLSGEQFVALFCTCAYLGIDHLALSVLSNFLHFLFYRFIQWYIFKHWHS